MNLITDAWLPVRRRSGASETIRPCELAARFAEDPIVALDFGRPEWTAAAMEWLVGLAALAFPPGDDDEWAHVFHAPPSPRSLAAALAPIAPAFELDGRGTRAFQDPDPLADAEVRPLSDLIIGGPGARTIDRNGDLFMHRGWPARLSASDAAAALMALQAYAPPGGGGHRGSLRGGGPLTTLVWPRQAGDAEPRLWDVVWSNVPPSSAAPSLDPFSAFPWMQPAAASDRGEVVSPGSAPAALAFFGCPRRIRLDFEDGAAVGLRSRPQGASYRGWVHPLSPYRRDPAGQLVAVHPRDEAFSYAQLPACWGLNGRAAAAVAAWPRRHRAAGGAVAETRLRIFGFDTENAKVRRWIEVEAPLLVIEDEARAAAVRALAEAAEAAGRALRHALRTVRFGRRTPSGYVLDNPAAIKDGGLSLEHFRRASEADFLRYAKGLALGLNGADGWQESFAGALHRAAAASFCNALDLEAETRRDAARLTRARAALDASFAAGGAVARILAPFRGAR